MKRDLAKLVLAYLRFWAKLQLSLIKPTIIGVTGSAGKTSTVTAITSVLSKKYAVKSTEGANSETGIPLSILNLKMTDYSPLDWLRILILAPLSIIHNPKFEILVAEMGIDELVSPKNMEYLLSIVRPKIGVFLNVLPVHTQQMGSVEKIAAEKGKLITSLPHDGYAIINSQDKLVTQFKNKTVAKVITFDGSTIAAANAIADIFKLPHINSFPVPAGRGRIFSGINGSTLIDQSYNASAIPTIRALSDLAKQKGKRKIAVLGDMRELGAIVESEHKKVAKEAFRLADEVITVGPLCKDFYPKDKKLVAQFDTASQAGKFLQNYLKPGDTVLFKGSQNTIFLETAVEMCLANKSDANLLCRRGKFWDNQRRRYKF